MKWSTPSLALALALGLNLAERCGADTVYLALGDSVTFGTDPSTAASLVPSYGDQGFVRPFADSLASLNEGIRPTVLNLGVPGEQSTSFFSAVTTPTSYGRAWQLNQNYPGATTSQDALMMSSIQAIHASGGSIGYVTLLIGSNDIYGLLGTPAFQASSPADQEAMLAAALGTVQANYLTILSQLKAMAPEATVILPTYYNPYPSSDPEHTLFASLIGGFDAYVQADAQYFGARYADLEPLFAGRELQLTNIGAGDIHPNQAGYALIAGALFQSVPEPSAFVLATIGLGSLGLVHAVRNRSRHRAA